MEPGLQVFAFRTPKSIFVLSRYERDLPLLPRLGYFFNSSNSITTEVQDGGHRSRVFGKFLAGSEAKDHRLHIVIIEQRAGQYAVFGRFDLLGEIDEVGEFGGHGYSLPRTLLTRISQRLHVPQHFLGTFESTD